MVTILETIEERLDELQASITEKQAMMLKAAEMASTRTKVADVFASLANALATDASDAGAIRELVKRERELIELCESTKPPS